MSGDPSSTRRARAGIVRLLRRLLVTVLACAVVIVGGPWALVHALSWGRTWTSVDAAPARDVVLVMGAATWQGQPSPYLKGRLDVALGLWRQGKAKVFIVSGSTSDYEPTTMRDYLVAQGVNQADVVLDEGGNDSYASCARAIGRFGVHRLTVVSQSYHVPRTVATCRLMGVDAVGVGDDSQPKDSTWNRYVRRELGANIKMIVDAIWRRDVGQHQSDPAVQDALGRHG